MTKNLLVLAALLINSGNIFAIESPHEHKHKDYNSSEGKEIEATQMDENMTSESEQSSVEADAEKKHHDHQMMK